MKKTMKRRTWLFVLAFLAVLGSGLFVRQAVKAESKSYTIYVNRQSNIVNVVNDHNKKVVRTMYCSTGKDNGTITGTFHTEEKYRWHALYGDVYGQYCTRINGPYLFHSIPYYSENNDAVETEEFNKLGTQASMGCVRLAVVDAKWIYDHCDCGTKVVIRDKKELVKPKYDPIKISTKKKAGWDPTDPDERNPYRPTLKLKNKECTRIEKGSQFDPMACIKAKFRTCDQEILLNRVKVKGNVNTKKAGSYKVKYTVQDPVTELKRSLEVTFTVTEHRAQLFTC